jgi:threonine/homoserine/homoserine lactone efflux protein
MDALTFVVTVILITASGALAPGPLFFAAISHGAKVGARSGVAFSIAHTLIEFALVMLLALGLLTVVNEPLVKLIVGILGGVVLVVFGAFQIRSSLIATSYENESGKMSNWNLLLIGLSFTGLNPFFIVWWLTAGAKLVLLSLEFASLAGVVLMYGCHVWMDYLWLTSVSHFAKIGMNVVGFKWYRIIIVFFGIVLIYFGIVFLIDALGV